MSHTWDIHCEHVKRLNDASPAPQSSALLVPQERQDTNLDPAKGQVAIPLSHGKDNTDWAGFGSLRQVGR